MRLFTESKGEYALINSEANTTAADKSQSRRRRYRFLVLLLTGVVCFFIGLAAGLLPVLSTREGLQQNTQVACQSPSVRREWRTLSDNEKGDYVRAVWCLKTIPSRVGANWTLYDDFPWVHAMVGRSSHDTAGFLAWHRYFIHIYEQALRNECGYRGHLAYWDWQLDWQDITKSPIWDTVDGFGSNSKSTTKDMSHLDPNFKGSCVDDGLLAGLEILHIGPDYKPHCLSRNLKSESAHVPSKSLKPASLAKVLQAKDYESFNIKLEDSAHLAIPLRIQGDFLYLTAPSDPVFILHHTQLDRLWWLWQQADPQARLTDYGGQAAGNSSSQASLSDIIPVGGLAADIEVGDIMSTEGDVLCYIY